MLEGKREMLLRTKQRFGASLVLRVGVLLCLAAVYAVLLPAKHRLFADDDQLEVAGDGRAPERRARRSLANETANGANGGLSNNCTPASVREFPWDGLDRQQRRAGWVGLHVLAACYCFMLLAIVCDSYFVPAVKTICRSAKMSEDVAGATLMAVASSSPELFINCVGTFVTEGDLGVGTIVGSAVFNVLAVPACCGLVSRMVLDLDPWAVSRDSGVYALAVLLLIWVLSDGRVTQVEALILVSVYIIYIGVIFFDDTLKKWVKRVKKETGSVGPYTEASPLIHAKDSYTSLENAADDDDICGPDGLFSCPSSTGLWPAAWCLASWPARLLLACSVPDCTRHPRLSVVTFALSVLWIGAASYVAAWMITIVGDTLRIPDSVMGLTFLAAGTSVPEAVSSVIVANQGHGGMGVSSSLGSNTFDILLCLGLPWLIKASFLPSVPDEHWVTINSAGLPYCAASLLSTLLVLYVSFACNRFKLDWKVGLACLVMYAMFLTLASLIELNFFFQVNLPPCDVS